MVCHEIYQNSNMGTATELIEHKKNTAQNVEEVMDSKTSAKVSTDGQTGRRLKRIAILVFEILLV